ncbi:hypothetical protein F5Y17DRAFT_254003 [Xylariaceae sp. FL0594]|nr:hypothetical protein F5Y17DRAFT_254003 [Xylariaceae sp. FL0594]
MIDRDAALTSKWGTNALHISAAADIPVIIEYLIKEKGMDPNAGDRHGNTPLNYAITSPRTTESLFLIFSPKKTQIKLTHIS